MAPATTCRIACSSRNASTVFMTRCSNIPRRNPLVWISFAWAVPFVGACNSETQPVNTTQEPSTPSESEGSAGDARPQLPACAQIVVKCHEKDDGKSERVSTCHTVGHDENEDACAEILDECLEACSGDMETFELSFGAMAGDTELTCENQMTGLGPSSDIALGISDLRFYVSNLSFLDEQGDEVPVLLDENEFQYQSENGAVSLIDLTSNTEGSCSGNAIAFAEGTTRVNAALRGVTEKTRVKRVRFDVGIPQPLMKAVIAAGTEEEAPSPMNEMYWSWASGYRHFVLNVTVEQNADIGDGYIHIGSRDCGAQGELALENQDACGLINTPQVDLEVSDLDTETVALNIERIVEGLDFSAPVYDSNFAVIGEDLGLECHSSPSQEDCASIFASFGLDAQEGTANASLNEVFYIQP